MLGDAQTCRENGWEVGQHLVGNEGYGPTVIVITAIGEECVLARAVSHRGEPVDADEGTWTLTCRNWQPVEIDSRPES